MKAERVKDLRCHLLSAMFITDVFLLQTLQSSCLQSVSIGWDGGVYVQTCGHTLHVDCHKSYMESLRVNWKAEIGLCLRPAENLDIHVFCFLACLFPLRTTRSCKAFQSTRASSRARSVDSLPTASSPVARGGMWKQARGTHPPTRRCVCW